MENLYYNLSEEEFSKGRKILLWIFALLFFIGGVYVITSSIVFGNKTLNASLSIAPFSISIVVFIIAAFATIKRKNLFFTIDNEKIEFRFGILKPKMHTFNWSDVKELQMPHKQRKAMLIFNDGSSFVINLIWLERRKSVNIRKHLFYTAKAKNLNVIKVPNLK